MRLSKADNDMADLQVPSNELLIDATTVQTVKRITARMFHTKGFEQTLRA